MEIRIAGTVSNSIVDGPGFRYALFVQGCPHGCPGCHNPETHSFSGGKISDTDTILDQIKEDPMLDGVTFSGGEPFCQALPLSILGRQIKELGLNVITYTGYTFEELIEMGSKNDVDKLLEVTDILIDGRFILDQRSLDIKFRGSKNQRVIDCKKSLALKKVVLSEYN